MKTTNRIPILLMTALLLAFTSACAVEEDNGLTLMGVMACQSEVPEDGATYSTTGYLDTYVKTMQQPQVGYQKQLFFTASDTSTVNDNFLQGEGNRLYLRGIQVSYDVPEGFPDIPKRFENLNMNMEPGARMLWSFTMLDAETIELIDQALKDNAYGTRRSVYLARPPAEDGGTDCTPLTASELCFGYACLAKDTGEVLTDPNAQGVCATTCSAQVGCSQVCAERGQEGSGVIACTNSMLFPVLEPKQFPAYYCDESADDIGVCRPTCGSNSDCAGLVEGYELSCVDNVCRPLVQNAEIDPYALNYVNVKIKLKAERTDGEVIWSNPVNYRLNVCRECMISFDARACFSSPLNDTDDEETWIELQQEWGNLCLFRYEEIETRAAWIDESYNWLCNNLYSAIAYDLAVWPTAIHDD